MESLKIYTQNVELSEVMDNGNLKLRFILCDFNPNLNGVSLDRETISEWMDTIKNQPLVGKIRANGKDFMGHEMKVVSKKNKETGEIEKVVEFDTSAVGVFYNVEICEIDGVEYLVADAEIWSRFPRVIQIITDRINSEDGLHTSWEVSVLESRLESGIKVIEKGCFFGHCLLGADVAPAYGCSGVLEAASTSDDEELYEAITLDVASQKELEMEDFEVMVSEETTDLNEESAVVEAEVSEGELLDGVDVEEVVEESNAETENAEEAADIEEVSEVEESEDVVDAPEVSSLTDRDIRRQLSEEMNKRHRDDCKYYDLVFTFPADFYALFHDYSNSDLEFTAVTYEICEDTVKIIEEIPVELVATIKDFNSEMSAKNDALVKANDRIQSLEAENSTLRPYKEAAEQAAAAKALAEKEQKVSDLKSYALKSKLISEEEISEESGSEISQMIAEANEDGVRKVIADRFMASLMDDTKPEVEVSEVNPVASVTASLINDEAAEKVNPISIYLNN